MKLDLVYLVFASSSETHSLLTTKNHLFLAKKPKVLLIII